ncbi:diguanylate cyclase [Burkholderia cepacia]|uniref:diguanylate cyclase domain-containing protein n=1 Tax=Burkholderia cepacia TaxID=292 RepID=UPI0007565775|nr:diguanylate cyclase [Burkholderia cepacia]KVR69020.1 diguanylate cyclase [Burkholderia cepacia]KWE18282.1 diguanylate cyclase [Burkholderia cepacia]
MFSTISLLEPILATPSVRESRVTPAIRASLLSSLFDDQRSLFLSGIASAFVALVAFLSLHRAWPLMWLVTGLAVLVARLGIARAYVIARRSAQISPLGSVKQYAPLALLASALLGFGSMGCLISRDAGASALAIMVTAGTLGGVASRNAGIPRLAHIQIVLGATPIGVGAVLAPTHVYWVLVPPLLAYIAAMVSIVRRHYSARVALMVAEQRNAELATRFDAALTHMPHGLCTIDDTGNVVIANRRTSDLFGATEMTLRMNVPLPEFIGHLSVDRFGEALRHQLAAQCAAWMSESRGPLNLKLGDWRQLEMIRNAVPDGSSVVIIEDVTERRRTEAKMFHWARHDPLTGLPNRRHLREQLGRMLAEQENIPEAVPAVIFLDLDNFKVVNDKLGHGAGDEVLRAVARRLRRILRHGENLARLGGDEFAIVVEHATPEATAALAQRVVHSLSEPYRLSTGAVAAIGASAGIALRHEGNSFKQLMERADSALYRAKASGKGTFCFSSASEEDSGGSAGNAAPPSPQMCE